MKRAYLIVVTVLLINLGAIAQEAFYGEWHMQEMSMESLQDKKVLTNEMIKAEGTVWIMKFDGDTFYQKSNFNARAEMIEMEGVWKTEPDERLTIFILKDGEKRPLKFFYEFKDEKMILERYDQLRTVRVRTVFKKFAS